MTVEDKRIITEDELFMVLKKLGISNADGASVKPFTSDEDGCEYAVWLVDTGKEKRVLKRAKGFELEVYKCFFSEKKPYVPELLAWCEFGDAKYFVTEYCPGEDLRICDRSKLKKVLDALIKMQDEYWERSDLYDKAVTFDKALKAAEDQGRYLGSPLLEKVYSQFLQVFRSVPLTLCHDDLLPINLLVGKRAVLIDWEYGGMHPYPESFARLTAHGREDRDQFFYMTDADREFAVGYYYDGLVKKHGISFEEYSNTLDHFLFYEYCEWVMLGNRYGSRDNERFEYYLKKAEEMAARLVGKADAAVGGEL